MRPLTREEQLDYQIEFLEAQINAMLIYLDNLKIEREVLRVKNLKFERNDK